MGKIHLYNLVIQLATLAVTFSLPLGCSFLNPDYVPQKAHHRPDGFVNTDGSRNTKSFLTFITWVWQRTINQRPPPPSTHVAGYSFPVIKPDNAVLSTRHKELRVTWLGHATALVQIGGFNVLTDPQFSERASPIQWLGPKRKVPLPLHPSELPHIDLVVISHNHYDHLDLNSVKILANQPGGSPLFAAPLGVDRWLREQGLTHVAGFDWWEKKSLTLSDNTSINPWATHADIYSVPVMHWSARTPFDRHQTLWSGWVIKANNQSVFFAGDTAYSNDFKKIKEQLGAMDLALIPVGAYEPRAFMASQHVNPEEAVKIHIDVGAKQSVGIHWGTFELADEPLDQPMTDLPKALTALGVPQQKFVLLKHGETRVIHK